MRRESFPCTDSTSLPLAASIWNTNEEQWSVVNLSVRFAFSSPLNQSRPAATWSGIPIHVNFIKQSPLHPPRRPGPWLQLLITTRLILPDATNVNFPSPVITFQPRRFFQCFLVSFVFYKFSILCSVSRWHIEQTKCELYVCNYTEYTHYCITYSYIHTHCS